MTEKELEGNVEAVEKVLSCEDANTMTEGRDCGSDEELRNGWENSDHNDTDQKEPTLLKSGKNWGGSFDKEKTDEADNEIVGQTNQPGGDEIVNGTATVPAKPGHISSLVRKKSQSTKIV